MGGCGLKRHAGMRDIYLCTGICTDWFAELAGKIAEGDEEYRVERTKRVVWKADRTAFTREERVL